MRSTTISERIVNALAQAHGLAGSESGPRAMEGESAVQPVITISREVGALGTAVAQDLGKKLKWPVYDRELINEIATQLNAPEPEVRMLDERTVGWLEGFASGFLSKKAISPYSYLKYLIATVRGLSEIGGCILVGRGGNFILPERALSVRLVASMEDRIRNVAECRGIPEKEAANWIRETERERTEFVRSNFGRDPEDPHEYDLVLNTSRWGVELCVETIVAALHAFEKQLRRPVS